MQNTATDEDSAKSELDIWYEARPAVLPRLNPIGYERQLPKPKISKYSVTLPQALTVIEDMQAMYANSGFNEERGVFWAHNGDLHREPDIVHRWWLLRKGSSLDRQR